jgi:hypothetical protein
MIDRRHAIRLALAAAVLSGLSLSAGLPARAQAFQRFFPFLPDLPGWKGNKPDGVALEAPGATVISATREYERGEARLNAQVIVGTAAMAALASIESGVKVETREARMTTTVVDGFKLARTYTIPDKSGAVLVALSNNGVFSLNFNGIDDEEALTIAKRFNWKGMQGAVPK